MNLLDKDDFKILPSLFYQLIISQRNYCINESQKLKLARILCIIFVGAHCNEQTDMLGSTFALLLRPFTTDLPEYTTWENAWDDSQTTHLSHFHYIFLMHHAILEFRNVLILFVHINVQYHKLFWHESEFPYSLLQVASSATFIF